MTDALLRRHKAGPIQQVSGYVDACYSLDAEAMSEEYDSIKQSAPTRSDPYVDERDISRRTEGSNRAEELLAHRMFLERTALFVADWPPMWIVDFQTPLTAEQSNKFGKVDLLGAGDRLCVIELKVLRKNRSGDTPLNALLEVIGYCAVVDANRDRIIEELSAIGHRIRSDRLRALVLAPDDYWARWDRTRRPQPWRDALTHAAGVISDATGLSVAYGSFDENDVVGTIGVTDPTV